MLACRPSLGYAILVSDLDRAIGFYRDVTGVPLLFRADAYAGFATDGAKFALFHAASCPG
jgi:catechol 2,3-dioxygenase-like lactoylglutathione lyase family enzyme